MARQATQDTVDVSVDAVADLTALVNDLRVANGTRAWVTGAGATHGLWCLDQTSALAVDGLTVVATLSGAGRWIYFGAGGGGGAANVNVPNEAALTALGVSALRDGALAWVGDPAGGLGRSQGSMWTLVTQQGALGGEPALAAHVVIASSAAGRVWMRLIEVVNQRWVQSTTWFLGGAGADDENDGQTAGTPLATGQELTRRLARQAVGGGAPVTVTIQAAALATPIDLTGVRGIVSIVGQQASLANGLLNASTAINRGANTFQTIGSAVFDFTPHVGRKIKLTSGAAGIVGAEAWIDSIPGPNQAITSPFTTQAGGPLSGAVAVVTPAGNEAFNIVSETTIPQVVVDGSSSSSFSQLLVALTMVEPTAQSDGFRCGTVLLNRLDFTPSPPALRLTGTAFAFLLGCQTAEVSLGDSAGLTSAAGRGTGPWIGDADGGGVMQFSQDQMMSDCTVFPNGGRAQLNAVGFLNTSVGRVAIDCRATPFAPASSVSIATALYGSIAGANTLAVLTGKYTTIDGGGVVPTLTSGATNVQFGSAAKAWAALPFVDQFDVGAGPVAGANMAGWL